MREAEEAKRLYLMEGKSADEIAEELAYARSTIYKKLYSVNAVKIKKSFVYRFWTKVDLPRDRTDCWKWVAGKDKPGGYGRIKFKNKHHLAHRVSWQFQNGSIPDDKIICHHCDNPPCVNPNHLFLGSYSDNAKDAVKKGRMSPPDTPKGSFKDRNKPHNRNMSDDKAADIKSAISSDEFSTLKEIAEHFGVTHDNVKDISAGRSYIHV